MHVGMGLTWDVLAAKMFLVFFFNKEWVITFGKQKSGMLKVGI